MLKQASSLIILAIDGWAESKGVKAEIEMAREFKTKIELMHLLNSGYTLEPYDREDSR